MRAVLSFLVVAVVAAGIFLTGCTAVMDFPDPPAPPDLPEKPNPPAPPKPGEYCRDGAPGAADPSRCNRGRFAINGIDRIPLSMVKLTNREMQGLYVSHDIEAGHANAVGAVMCESYITAPAHYYNPENCDESPKNTHTLLPDGSIVRTTGSSLPFTQIVVLKIGWNDYFTFNETQAIDPLIVVYPMVGATGADKDAAPPYEPTGYLTVQSAANTGNYPWFNDDDVMSGGLGKLADRQAVILAAIAVDKLIITAGWEREHGTGNYIRGTGAGNCLAIPVEGCIWAEDIFDFSPDPSDPYTLFAAGNSYGAPHFASALASILAVFPDTTHQDLVRLGRACAKKRGEGIEKLLAVSGGIGIADFACMDTIIPAAQNLPSGGSTSVTVDGKTITVTERQLTVH